MTLIELLVVTTIVCCLVGMMVPSIAAVREAARRTACGNNVRQVAVATLQHESAHRRLPSNQRLAWTQQIDMQIGNGAANATALAEASDSERERLLHLLPDIFRCPSASTVTIADYPAAHVGHNPLLLGERLAMITDGTSKTLLVGEVQPAMAAPWVLGPTVTAMFFGSDHRTGSHIALADGASRFVPPQDSTTQIDALMSPAGGEN